MATRRMWECPLFLRCPSSLPRWRRYWSMLVVPGTAGNRCGGGAGCVILHPGHQAWSFRVECLTAYLVGRPCLTNSQQTAPLPPHWDRSKANCAPNSQLGWVAQACCNESVLADTCLTVTHHPRWPGKRLSEPPGGGADRCSFISV